MTDAPKWFDWTHWGLGLGSDTRYKPKWFERRAYVMGLRDAARIAETCRFSAGDNAKTDTELRARRFMGREVIARIHKAATDLLGLPADRGAFP
jgi:hypothetical protein